MLLSLELSAVTAAEYRVTIFDRSEQVVWRGEGLEPSLYDTLMIAVPSSFLSPGEYRATIESLPFSTGGTVDTLEFRVVADRMSGR